VDWAGGSGVEARRSRAGFSLKGGFDGRTAAGLLRSASCGRIGRRSRGRRGARRAGKATPANGGCAPRSGRRSGQGPTDGATPSCEGTPMLAPTAGRIRRSTTQAADHTRRLEQQPSYRRHPITHARTAGRDPTMTTAEVEDSLTHGVGGGGAAHGSYRGRKPRKNPEHVCAEGSARCADCGATSNCGSLPGTTAFLSRARGGTGAHFTGQRCCISQSMAAGRHGARRTRAPHRHDLAGRKKTEKR